MAAPAALSVILGITDKGPDLSSLLPSCFRTEIYSSWPPISPLPISGIPPSIAMKPLQPGTLQLLPRLVDAKESSPGTGGSTIRSCSGKATPPHKPSNCSTVLAAATSLMLCEEHDSAALTLQPTDSNNFCARIDHPGLSETMKGVAWPQTCCSATGHIASPYRRKKEQFLYHLH